MQVVNTDFMSFVETVASNDDCKGQYFVDFFEQLLQYYEEREIDLATSTESRYLANDNYRFFNYELFLSFVSIMLKNERFDILSEVIGADFCILSNRFGRQVKALNFTEFQKYNYTLDYYKKGVENSNAISETANLMESYAGSKFAAWVESDILLYYLSLLYNHSQTNSFHWYPTLSIYNHCFEILPKLVSERYFEKAKILFGVADKDSFKTVISQLKDDLDRDGVHRIPEIKLGLSVDKIGSLR